MLCTDVALVCVRVCVTVGGSLFPREREKRRREMAIRRERKSHVPFAFGYFLTYGSWYLVWRMSTCTTAHGRSTRHTPIVDKVITAILVDR